jgi:hypothetical protein
LLRQWLVLIGASKTFELRSVPARLPRAASADYGNVFGMQGACAVDTPGLC